jgi:hypothetical protein
MDSSGLAGHRLLSSVGRNDLLLRPAAAWMHNMSEQIPPDMTNYPSAYDVLNALAREVVLENVSGCLRQSPYPQLWKVTCDFYEGVLTLHGIVDSFFLKQLAHIAVVDVEGVNEIANGLEVQYPESK